MPGSDFSALSADDLLLWIAAAGLVMIAVAFGIPSSVGSRSNLAPPVMLAFFTVGQPSLSIALLFTGAVVIAHPLVGWVPKRHGSWRRVPPSVASCIAMAALWLAASQFHGATVVAKEDVSGAFALLGVAALWALADGVIGYWASPQRQFRPTFLSSVIADLPLALLAAGSAAVVAMMWIHVGMWAAAVGAIPYVVTHRLVSALLVSRRIERLALRAIGRLPEAAGLVESDHSAGVEVLAFQIGWLHGIRGRALNDLRRAAVLHEVGLVCQICTGDLTRGYSLGDVARWGSEVIAASSSLSRVARLIEGQAEPFRIPGSEPDPTLDIRSQVIKLACELDHLRNMGLQPSELLDAVHSESSFRFPPALVSLVEPALKQTRYLGGGAVSR